MYICHRYTCMHVSTGRTLANERNTKAMERDTACASIYKHSNKISKMHSLRSFCRWLCETASTMCLCTCINSARLCNDEGFHVRAMYDTILKPRQKSYKIIVFIGLCRVRLQIIHTERDIDNDSILMNTIMIIIGMVSVDALINL